MNEPLDETIISALKNGMAGVIESNKAAMPTRDMVQGWTKGLTSKVTLYKGTPLRDCTQEELIDGLKCTRASILYDTSNDFIREDLINLLNSYREDLLDSYIDLIDELRARDINENDETLGGTNK